MLFIQQKKLYVYEECGKKRAWKSINHLSFRRLKRKQFKMILNFIIAQCTSHKNCTNMSGIRKKIESISLACVMLIL